MNLSLSDEQRLIADSAGALLQARCTPADVRVAMAGPDGHDAALWHQLVEQGWCGLLLPEAANGQDLGLSEAVMLLEALGAHLACVPYFDSAVLATSALLACGAPPQALGALGRGEQVLALAFDEVPAQAVAGGWLVSGCWPAVGSAHLADAWLLPVVAGHTLLLQVDRHTPGFSHRSREGVDATRRSADVWAKAAFVPSAGCVASGANAQQALQQARLHGAMALAAEQLGVATRCLELARAHTLQREQFGRPLASFQALKHRMAQMLVAVEAARSAVWGAACVADAEPTPDELHFAAAQALCAAHEAACFASQEALQLHGGMGYTWACDAHLYLRRAQANRQRLGPASAWLEGVAARLLGASPSHAPAGVCA